MLCTDFSSMSDFGIDMFVWVHYHTGKPATQSSLLKGREDLYQVRYGNDGDPNTFFHASKSEKGPWWNVDLESDYCIVAVNLINRPQHAVYSRFTYVYLNLFLQCPANFLFGITKSPDNLFHKFFKNIDGRYRIVVSLAHLKHSKVT